MRTFDCVVLGTGIAGCAAAALLAKLGKRILIVGSSRRSDSGTDLETPAYDGFGEGSVWAYGFEHAGAWRDILHELEIDTVVTRECAGYQIALPDRRITVSPDPITTLSNLRGEYRVETTSLEKFYRDCIRMADRMERSRLTAYLGRHRSARSFVHRYGFSASLRAFFSASSLYFFGVPLEDLSVAELALLIARPPRLIEDGLTSTTSQLLEKIREKGGECMLSDGWPQVQVEHNRVRGITLGQEEVGCRTVLLDMPRSADERTYGALINRDAVPVGMLDLVLSVAGDDRPFEQAVFSLTAASAGNAIPGGRVLLQVHFRQEDPVTDEIAARRVMSLMPFVHLFSERSYLRNRNDGNIPVPKGVVVRPVRPNRQGLDPVRFSVRNLHLLNDSAFGVARSVSAVRAVVGRIA